MGRAFGDFFSGLIVKIFSLNKFSCQD